ncbi:hypothetical protein D3C79_646060 [compost metagenome]
MCLCFAQRFGGDNIAAGGQHLATQFAVQIVEVRIAAEHQSTGLHRTLSGMHPHLCAVVDAGDRRLFEQANPKPGGHGSLTQGQIQRVQMPRTHIDQATDITV